MGNILKAIFGDFGTERRRILLLGLDAAGKTSVLYKFKMGENVHTIPTVGFNVETIKYKNIEFTAWDIGGQDRLRSLWSYYFHNTDALIWVLDANDAERYQESANELQKLMRHPELERSSLLVYANKTDLPGARSVSEIADALGLSSIRGREWYIQSTSAITGEGLYEGLEWVAKSLKNKPSN